ncbi:predicted protein [Thalassiosira pseudonana CCMP1335]|uniref:DNA2/NAM7 helicase-like C-terminal domain-containing protein n=1 Tax=Thalassiosira pseudonana TaxID=35128 RepID=B8CEE9_THAPS|nr:predicted protein [Thalassiosira pseudonana CCMP1335]EED88367.1 predicted protein [Thalassiosira pseudonana CCMP1335]
MSGSGGGFGYSNQEEVEFITRDILSLFTYEYLRNTDVKVSIGIISFYKEQVKRLQRALASVTALDQSRISIKVATVDGFQGSECDIIILSCVRSHSNRGGGNGRNNVGFLNDYRRVNVALTRAKCSLWIVGNSEVLKSSNLWSKLIQHMEGEKALQRSSDFRSMFAQWKASKERSFYC